MVVFVTDVTETTENTEMDAKYVLNFMDRYLSAVLLFQPT